MKEHKEELQNLIAMAQLHIAQEHRPTDWLMTDRATYEDYRKFAVQNPTKKTAAVKQQPATSPPPQKQPPPSPLPKIEPKPPVKVEKPVEVKFEETKIELQKDETTKTADFTHVRALVEKLFPHQKIVDPISDQVKSKLLPEILVLCHQEPPLNAAFLSNYAKALEICLGPTQILSPQDSKLPSLLHSAKLVIGIETFLKALNLATCKTLTLEPVNHYLKNPQLKATLWSETKRLYTQSAA